MSNVWIGLSARTIANYFLELGRRDWIPIDPMKLQKLVYLAHGWSLLFLNKPLIREPIEAWRYGPVVPELYQEFKRFGGSPITQPAQMGPGESTSGLDQETKSLLEAVWERYKSLSPIQLSILTHEAGSAWDLIQRQTDFSPWGGPRIPNGLIADEFTRRQQQDNNHHG
jgi:uncharacterized phage-associated protein